MFHYPEPIELHGYVLNGFCFETRTSFDCPMNSARTWLFINLIGDSLLHLY